MFKNTLLAIYKRTSMDENKILGKNTILVKNRSMVKTQLC